MKSAEVSAEHIALPEAGAIFWPKDSDATTTANNAEHAYTLYWMESLIINEFSNHRLSQEPARAAWHHDQLNFHTKGTKGTGPPSETVELRR